MIKRLALAAMENLNGATTEPPTNGVNGFPKPSAAGTSTAVASCSLITVSNGMTSPLQTRQPVPFPSLPLVATTSTSSSSGVNSNQSMSISNGNPPTPATRQQQQRHQGIVDTEEEDDGEDEYCFYTYKGDSRAAADLPSSFYRFDSSDGANSQASTHDSHNGTSAHARLTSSSNETGSGSRSLVHNGVGHANDNNGAAAAVAGANNVFSPDMDFLEMDFDPGGAGDEDEDEESDPRFVDEFDPLNRNALLSQVKFPIPVQQQQQQPLTSPTPSSSRANASNRNEIAVLPIDLTDGDQCQGSPTRAATIEPLSSINNERSPECSPNVSVSVESPEPKPHFSKRSRTLNLGEDNPSSSSSGIGSSSSRISTVTDLPIGSSCTSCFCSSGIKYNTKSSRLRGNGNTAATATLPGGGAATVSIIRSPTNQFSLRLVKSNTLPEIGRHLRRNSDPSGVGGTTSNFTSGMSFSVPVIKDEPHFRAVINTSTSTPDSTSSSSKTEVEPDYSVELEVGSVMIWTLEEAYELAVTQIGISACGATAVYNVLSALGYEDIKPTVVNECVGTRVRAELADLPEYLFSRCKAGATHEDLISGIQKMTDGSVNGKFFRPSPNISPDIFSKWLLHWICKGAIPVLTRNLQIQPRGTTPSEGEDGQIPDSWHHQMVFGVSPGVLFLSNPIECADVSILLPQLTSSSELLIRRNDIICRRTPRTDLRLLARNPDPRWNELNVLGQVANILLEDMPSVLPESRRHRTSHIRIPADYKGGVTLFLQQSSPAYSLLMSAPDL